MTELLSPAGNFDKLRTSLLYGADAVYLSGFKFGLRSGNDNFDLPDLKRAVDYAHMLNKRVYVTLNSFMHQSDMPALLEFIRYLDSISVDAAIISDIGVAAMVLENSKIKIHVSTQASVVNHQHGRVWKDFGAKRIVVGREISLKEAALIKEKNDIEVEVFCHGAMCMSYSGHCTISNYTAGRDSNRGGCIQSCRHYYDIESNDKSDNKTFMSSKDLMGLLKMREIYELGIDSIKIEGRMKSQMYAATSSLAYSKVLQALKENQEPDFEKWAAELEKLPHRGYTDGSLETYAAEQSIYIDHSQDDDLYAQSGYVVDMVNESEALYYSTANVTDFTSEVEFVCPQEGNKSCAEAICRDMTDQQVVSMIPNHLYKIQLDGLQVGNVARINRSLYPIVKRKLLASPDQAYVNA